MKFAVIVRAAVIVPVAFVHSVNFVVYPVIVFAVAVTVVPLIVILLPFTVIALP